MAMILMVGAISGCDGEIDPTVQSLSPSTAPARSFCTGMRQYRQQRLDLNSLLLTPFIPWDLRSQLFLEQLTAMQATIVGLSPAVEGRASPSDQAALELVGENVARAIPALDDTPDFRSFETNLLESLVPTGDAVVELSRSVAASCGFNLMPEMTVEGL